jgi:dephospho-CoA kinase
VLRVALTGGIATGKSYVRRRVADAGIPTIDADILAREVVAPGSPGLAAVVARFGTAVVNADGTLDRRALGATVFGDRDARRALEAIIHPAVRQASRTWLEARAAEGVGIALADIPLLFETGRDVEFDRIIVTTCPADTQVARIVSRDRLTEPEARARIAAQWPLAEKVRRAHHVIDTSGTFADTDRQVDEVVMELRAGVSHGPHGQHGQP